MGKWKKSELKMQAKNALSSKGNYISVDDGSPKSNVEGLELLKEMYLAGKLKAVIDTSYPLEQIVEAHKYVDKGHKKGNVVIKVN